MKKALIAAVIVALAAGGSLAAWRLLDDDSRREGALVRSSNVLTSPNGDFTLAVEDTGIVMKGLGSSIELTPGGLTVKSAAVLSIHGSSAVTVQGPLVSLGCASGGRPIARVGDLAAGGPAPNPILPPGSTTVLAC